MGRTLKQKKKTPTTRGRVSILLISWRKTTITATRRRRRVMSSISYGQNPLQTSCACSWSTSPPSAGLTAQNPTPSASPSTTGPKPSPGPPGPAFSALSPSPQPQALSQHAVKAHARPNDQLISSSLMPKRDRVDSLLADNWDPIEADPERSKLLEGIAGAAAQSSALWFRS